MLQLNSLDACLINLLSFLLTKNTAVKFSEINGLRLRKKDTFLIVSITEEIIANSCKLRLTCSKNARLKSIYFIIKYLSARVWIWSGPKVKQASKSVTKEMSLILSKRHYLKKSSQAKVTIYLIQKYLLHLQFKTTLIQY